MNLEGLTKDEENETLEPFTVEAETPAEKQAAEAEAKQPATETPASPQPLPDGEIDLFAELSKPTDKDILKAEGKNPADINDTSKNAPKVELSNHQLTAKLTIAAVSVGMGMLMQFISDDWSEEGEKRYSLSPSRKSELLEPLEIMLANSKKKYNPVVVLVITILITYIPMTINAMRYRKNKQIEKRKKVYGIKTEAEETDEPAEGETVNAEPVKKNSELNKISERVKLIKSKKGRRSLEDAEFLKSVESL